MRSPDWMWHRSAFHVAGAIPTVFTSGVAKTLWIELEFVLFMCIGLLAYNDGTPVASDIVRQPHEGI